MLITLARKPLVGTVASNVLAYGCGALNIDATRIGTDDSLNGGAYAKEGAQRHDGTENWRYKREGGAGEYQQPAGRWPANILLVPTPDVLVHFPEVKGQVGMTKTVGGHRFIVGDTTTVQKFDQGKTDTGSAARFFKQVGEG